MTATHVHGLMVDLLALRKRQAAPFGERAAAFVAGLRALTRKTGVAVTSTAALGAWNQIEMIDAAGSPRGQYLQDDTDLEWVRGEDEDPMPYGDRVGRHGVRGALAAASGRWLAEATDAAGKAFFGPPPAPLTLADVIQAESALANANVTPPYELRATAAALAGLAAMLAERCNAEATEPEPMPALQPGETFVGRVSHTLLIAVDEPPSGARLSGNREAPAF